MAGGHFLRSPAQQHVAEPASPEGTEVNYSMTSVFLNAAPPAQSRKIPAQSLCARVLPAKVLLLQ